MASGVDPCRRFAGLRASGPGGRISRRAAEQRGTSVVEFALCSAILLTLAFGVLALSLAVYSYHFISEAARQGTRYAMVRGSTCQFSNPCTATSDEIQSYVQGLAFPGINPSQMTVTTKWPSGKDPGDPVEVTVTYAFPLWIPFVPSQTLTMTSSSQMTISE
jgi:Flp pilus assembly protein TadG